MGDREQAVQNILRGHFAYWEALGRLHDNTARVSGPVHWLSGHLYHTYYARFDPDAYPRQCEDVIRAIREKELPGNLLIGPDSLPDTGIDLREYLVRTEHFAVNRKNTGMAKRLDGSKAETMESLDIRRITEDRDLKMAGAILNGAFEYDLFTAEHYRELFAMPQVAFYLAEYQGLPVSACMAIQEDSFVEIAWVGTVPGYRKKGIVGALLGAVERDAFQSGREIAVLSAFEAAVGAYRHVGYEPCCTFYSLAFQEATASPAPPQS